MNGEIQNQEVQEGVSVEIEEQDGDLKAEAQDSGESGTIVRNSDDQDSELENYSDNVQKRINQLTAKRKQALEESEAAYAYANHVKSQNDELRKRIEDLDKGYINEYGSRVETQEAAAKNILKEAYDAGDTDRIAEANAALAQLAVEKERLRVQRVRSEQQAAQPQEVEQPQPQQVRRTEDLDPKLQSWMQRNPWFGTDAAMTGAAQGIHQQIVGSEGFDPSSDDYYAEIDRRMGAIFDKLQGSKQNAPAVAPASSTGRSATKRGRKSGKTVELTPGQVAFATKMKIPLEKYAQEVARLEKQRSA